MTSSTRPTRPTAVQQLRDLGYALVPGDLDKRPSVAWGAWRHNKQTDEEFESQGHGSVWGIVTGQVPGLVVLDFDGPEGVALAQRFGLSPNVITGSGGWHVWVEAPAWPVKTCAGVLPGLDVRGEGGLAWCAGRSRKGDYRLVSTALTPSDGLDALLPERTAPASNADLGEWDGDGDGRPAAIRVLLARCSEVALAQPGTRNSTLNRAAYAVAGLVAAGDLSAEVALNALYESAERCGAEDVVRVVESAFTSGRQAPWSAEPQPDESGRAWAPINNPVPSTRVWDPSRQPLPLDCFPKEVRSLVESGAPIVCTPPEYLAAATLPALASAIGGLTTLDLRSTWRIPPSLYLGLVGPPSASKTPALSLALRPVRAAERGAWEAAGGEPETRYLVDDVTVEKLAELLAQHKRGLLVAVDELKGFFGGMGAYKDGGGRDRQFYLSAWSSEPITVDRIRRGSRYVVQPTLSVVGGIQPEVFDQMTDGTADGMLERFLLVSGEAVAAVWREDDIPAGVLDAYDALWNGVRDANMTERQVGLTPAARSAFKAWYNPFHALRPVEQMARIHGKMRTHVPRLALILACCDDTDVAPEHLERAVTIAAWFAGESLHVLRTSESSRPDERRHEKVRERLVSWLDRFETTNGRRPTRREALQRGPLGARRARELDPLLAEIGVVL